MRSALSMFRPQSAFYAVSVSRRALDWFDSMSAFDSRQAALRFAGEQKSLVPSGETGVQWHCMSAEELKMGWCHNVRVCEMAGAADARCGRVCAYTLAAFIREVYGKQSVFADMQGVDADTVSRWKDKAELVVWKGDGWGMPGHGRKLVVPGAEHNPSRLCG